MNYTIDKHSSEPVYIQIYHYLTNDIINGIYPYGSKLPSKRLLSEEMGISLITVQHALDLLIDEGYLEAKQRSGYYVIYRHVDFLSHLDKPVTYSTISSEDLDIGEFPFSTFAKTTRKVLLDYGEKVLDRTPNQGLLELKTEICNYLARSRSITVKPEQIYIGSGAEYLYGIIGQYFGTHQIFAIENPSYEKIQKVYQSIGIQCDLLTLTPSGIDSTELSQTKATILHVTPFNSYPSGISVGINKKLEYLRWANQSGHYIIEDNYDSELTVSQKNEDSLFKLSSGKKVIYLNTFSETISSSIRIGYIVLPIDLVERFHQKVGFYSCTVPLLEQYILVELLKSGDFERHLNRIRRRKRKQLSNS